MVTQHESILKSEKYQKIKGGKHAKNKLWRKSGVQLLSKTPVCGLSGLIIVNYKGCLSGRIQGRKLPSSPPTWDTASALQFPKGVAVKDARPLVAISIQSAFFLYP